MKLWLVAPASGRWREVGKGLLFNGRTFRFSMLSLLTVAAETPPDVEVRIIDEQCEDIPWDDMPDLVGLTCMTALAPRAYELAARFRARGVPVVLGGMHPTLCPGEALRHADAVMIGEAEGIWPRVVEDARAGRLRGVYRSIAPPSLDRMKPLPRHLLRRGRYATLHAVQATRGCPHGCDFCAVSAFSRHTQRRRPVADVAAEAAGIPDRFFVFVDDNLTADAGYAAELFRALAPLRKRWIAQSTLAFARDPALVELAAHAGCRGVFVGLETFCQENLAGSNKTCHRVEAYRDAIRLLHRHGIAVEAGIVFGFDGDEHNTFRDTLCMLDELEVDVAQFSIFTPLPGTPRAEAMRDRVFDRDWAHYDFHHAVFHPVGMTTKDLQAGHDWATRAFYRPWRIARRVWRHALRPGALGHAVRLAVLNLAYYGRVVRWGIKGWDPGQEQPAPNRRAEIRGWASAIRPRVFRG